ncbi:RagB/SusD family nutrient uptake outer membrane protein [Fodinibius salsisoli]|uniref:RagB/SusD family nutrient uptake outer membrane protein n=1 Tax=Fodinibius salsisoli TaxID=2820877 RepID=A0ABT3PJJ5_9BACT|nr:RagB/SusD family nutrient uptake outer membrane protein [Fodinibius salsisoli]MCW9706077.1 RagB/SusD family nutrient uptake outer membrane protein [Fodinibius salsisoli]
MKMLKYILILVIIFTTIGGCKENLLDTTPYSQIGSGNMWDSENLVEKGVNGVYNTLRYTYVGNELWMLDQDAFTGSNRDRTSWILGSSTLKSGVITAADGLFQAYWQQHYEGIHRANDAIENLTSGVPVSEEKTARLIAEMKFLRAYFYFGLNRVYKGVPIYLEPVPAEEVNRPRETEQAVWDVIIKDLTASINEANLPDMYARGDANKGHATKAAAYALRGKAYLYMEEYAKAEEDLRKVGDLGPALFQGDYKDLFKEANEDHPEMIFSVQNIALSGLGTRTQKHVGTRVAFGSNWNNHLPNVDFVESYENADGSEFKWDEYLPGYSSMSPTERKVFFLRDGLTQEEQDEFESQGVEMSLYLPNGNEARVKAAYENRDPRLQANIITPYSEFHGAAGSDEFTYTLRWPYIGYDRSEPFDLRTDTNSKFYYLWRKWVYEGASIENRAYGPTDQPLIRYADVLLMLAEAINEQGFDQEAVSILNQVRDRAGAALLQTGDPSLPTYVSGQKDLRERIRNERRWEFPLEGINLFDEMRWETWKETKFAPQSGQKEIWGAPTYEYSWRGDHLYTWPIPRTEIERNPNIEQNSGWE